MERQPPVLNHHSVPKFAKECSELLDSYTRCVFYSVIFCTLQNTTHGRGQNLVRFGWVFYFRNVKISTVVRQWRNSHELYQARTRGTQIIGLSGEHPDLSSGSLFVQFARFRNSYTAIKLHPHIWYITWQSRRDSRS